MCSSLERFVVAASVLRHLMPGRNESKYRGECESEVEEGGVKKDCESAAPHFGSAVFSRPIEVEKAFLVLSVVDKERLTNCPLLQQLEALSWRTSAPVHAER